MAQQRELAMAELPDSVKAGGMRQRPRARPSAGSLHQQNLDYLRDPPPPGHALDNYAGEPEAAQVISGYRSKARSAATGSLASSLYVLRTMRFGCQRLYLNSFNACAAIRNDRNTGPKRPKSVDSQNASSSSDSGSSVQ